MKKAKAVTFHKMQASGNDFILIDNRKKIFSTRALTELAQKYCRRCFGVGANGLLVIEPAKNAAFFMRVFNPDGSEVDMCGNGARCAALWAFRNSVKKAGLKTVFQTRAGMIEAKCSACPQSPGEGNLVSIKMIDPFDFRLLLPLAVKPKIIKVNYVNTGVPHAVVFVQGLEGINIEAIGRTIRYHNEFAPQGTNVNFVEFIRSNFIRVRTYERGVEAETLACGSGATASAIVAWFMAHGSWAQGKKTMRVKAKSNEVLKVHFTVRKEHVEDVWLEGKAFQVYTGIFNQGGL